MQKSKGPINIDEILERVQKVSSLENLNMIINDHDLDSAIKSVEAKYPKVNLAIKQDDVAQLIQSGILNKDHTLNESAISQFNTLSRLLLAVLWKNGHFYRVKHLVDGITEDIKSESEQGLIFRQFGRSLCQLQEPIIDQHVLRAFKSFSARKDVNELNEENLMEEYRHWFKTKIFNISEADASDFKYKLDKILFITGKALKR